MENIIFLSYILNENSPSYGNRNVFQITKNSDINKGDIANDSSIKTTVHIGTHLDMPYHFYEDGQTIGDFPADFWVFSKKEILFIELKVENGELIIKDKLIDELEKIVLNSQFSILNYKLLIVKTGICNIREDEKYWKENYGFAPEIYDYLIEKFTNIRVFGFDSISISCFKDRMIGREAHKRFLNPKRPILLLEDMDLRYINKNINLNKIIIAPLRIAKCDGLPCTIIGVVNE